MTDGAWHGNSGVGRAAATLAGKSRPLRRWLWLLVALAGAALPALLDRLVLPPAATRLTQASVGRTPDDDRARPVALPHRWAADPTFGCPDCQLVWYGFDLDRTDPPRHTQAVLLPRVHRNAAIYLNGRLLVQGGRFDDPAARLGARPLWATAPPAQWNAGPNRLYVLVKADRARLGAMPAPALADEDELQMAYQARLALTVTAPQVAATAAVMLALLMGVLGYYRRHESDYAALAVAAAAFAAQVFAALTVEPPWGDRAWDASQLALLWLLAAAVLRLSVLLVSGRAIATRQWWGVTLAVVASIAALAPLESAGLGLQLAQQASYGPFALAGGWLAWGGWRRSDARLLVPGALLLGATAWDAFNQQAAIEAMPASPLALAACLGMAAWLLLLRFVQTLNTVELLKIDLEALVAERTIELQAQFGRVRELERQQVVAGERERLMRDMHDGVGGHLVSMLAMIEADRRRPAELAAVVRDALDDMRLMIDSLEPVDDDLNAVLAMFHDRLAPRLRASKVELHWGVDLLPRLPGLTPARVLHVLRMLQEGVSNAIRHGAARTLWIDAQVDEGAGLVRLSVRDDGTGFDPQRAASGRGLKNMQRRAREVGACVEVRSAPGAGATVAIELPLSG